MATMTTQPRVHAMPAAQGPTAASGAGSGESATAGASSAREAAGAGGQDGRDEVIAAAAGSGGSPATSRATSSGASGADASVARGTLDEQSGVYTFTFGRRTLAIDAAHGARVTRFGLDGSNLLTGPDVDALNFGSTFWPSPQQRWGWPPVPELDSEPYEVVQEPDAVIFASKQGMRAKVSVKKRVRAMAAEDSAEITYTLVNEDSRAVAWAPWEITRVAASGLSFFPTGQRQVATDLAVVEQAGVTWFQHDPAALGGDGKKFTGDGAEGWLAHVSGRTLLLKQFMDVPASDQAPAPEAEIAIYAAQGYVEIEPQGPYRELTPGQELSWTVRWRVAELPPDLEAKLGDPALVELARALAARPGS